MSGCIWVDNDDDKNNNNTNRIDNDKQWQYIIFVIIECLDKMVRILTLGNKMYIDFPCFGLSGHDTYFHLHNVEFTLLLVSIHS